MVCLFVLGVGFGVVCCVLFACLVALDWLFSFIVIVFGGFICLIASS